MGYGHRLLILREMFGHFFGGGSGGLPEDSEVEVDTTTILHQPTIHTSISTHSHIMCTLVEHGVFCSCNFKNCSNYTVVDMYGTSIQKHNLPSYV